MEILLTFLGLLTASTLLSLFEVSILTISPMKLDTLVSKNAKLKFFDARKEDAAALVMIVNFLVDYLGAMLLSNMIYKAFDTPALFIAASFVTSLLTLYVATLAAKLFASKRPELIIKNFGLPIIIFYWVMKPFVTIVSAPILYLMKNLLNSDESERLSDTELLSVLSIAKKEGLIRASQHKFIKRLITLQYKTVGEIIPPNQVIESVSISDSILDLEHKLLSGCHKRLVVTKPYNGKEYPIGILMFSAIAKANIEHLNNIIDGKKDVHVPTIAEIMKPCIVTSVTTSAEELVDRLDKGNHIVVAIGEHGDMAGIIQSDDIIHVLTT